MFKLFYTPTSPYVRKVLVAAHELGMREQVETVLLRPTPTKAHPEISAKNPLAKIPALIFADGRSLYDSPVIVEYLESVRPDGAPRLVPASGEARFNVLRLQALCDGILEAAILVFYERLQRPPEYHWQDWLAGQTEKANQGLDALDAEAATFGHAVDLGQICAAVTIGWLEFRNVIGDLRAGRPHLAAWYQRFSARPSMTATVPFV